ncbi:MULTISPECIES: hypothetical protein [Xanthobacter]|uniref:hypothetical protein n=1 Tax=Xanthobacter TaxID=279 RepID=UPI001F3CD485|nr:MULTISPECIES: hypothetical protein [unclassified Xanthobacter]
MTITINVPLFPMRKEIAARKERRGLKIGTLMFHNVFGSKKAARRYSREGLEFDVSDFAKPNGSGR